MSRVMRSREERTLERVARHSVRSGENPDSQGKTGDIEATTFRDGRQGIQVKASKGWVSIPEPSETGAFGFTVGQPTPGSPVIQVGTKGYLRVPYDCTITGWSLVASTVGDLVLDLRYTDWPDYPPWPQDSIVGATPPELNSVSTAKQDALVDWGADLVAGGIVACVVTSCTDIGYFTLNVQVTRKK